MCIYIYTPNEELLVTKRTGSYGIPVASDTDGERERERERERGERERESGYFKLLNTIFFVFKKSMLLLQPLQVNDNHFWGDKFAIVPLYVTFSN